MNHDEALMRAFVRPYRRQRYIEMLKKDRDWVTGRLNHFHDLDMRFATRIPKEQQDPRAIYELLRDKGAPDLCHVLGSRDLDGLQVRLADAVRDLFFHDIGFMISCIEGRLGYFQDEELGEKYILERPRSETVV